MHVVDYARLVINNIFTVQLALNPERTDFPLRREDASVVAAKVDRGITVDGDTL
jgi:5,10-methylenetetrahydrofolate reductase